MIFPDLVDIPIEQFGGYVPAMPPTNLPPGASWSCQDCEFPMGGVRTRDGLQAIFPGSPIPANAAINGLKTYRTPLLQNRLMVWDSIGNLYKESPQGTIGIVGQRPLVGANLLYQSTTLFGREYQAFFNISGGADIPRQFDDTNWDRVSQVGPGQAPTVQDDSGSTVIAAAPGGAAMVPAATIIASPNGLTVVGRVVTVNILAFGIANPAPQVNDQFQIAGAGNPAFNGTWTISNVINPFKFQFIINASGLANSGGGTVQFSWAVITTLAGTPAITSSPNVKFTVAGVAVGGYNGTWPSRSTITGSTIVLNIGTFGLAASGAGTIVAVGNIVAGLHLVSVAFITRQGFITQLAPWGQWTSVGGNVRANVQQIPIGPANVVSRLIVFTPVVTPPATQGTFFSLPNGSQSIPGSVMLINDNVTTQAFIDFNDTVLIAGFNAEYLFNQLELGECSFVGGYNSRLCWLGERAKVPNFVNLTFEGGFGTNGLPNGWSAGTNYAGFTPVIVPANADWMNAASFVSTGAAICGQIQQPANLDFLGQPIIANNTAYSLRVRLARTNGLLGGVFQIQLTSLSAGLLGSFAVNAVAMPFFNAAGYQEFTGQLIAANIITGPVPNDMVLSVQLAGAGAFVGEGVFADSIEIFQTNIPYNYSTARFSHAFNPESYDSITGQVQVRPNDGQQMRAAIPLRNNYYLAKDHYLCYVTDDGVNEPASWPVNEVSATIGICGPNAWDTTEEWFVSAERSGAYICWGSDPVKISQEIDRDASAQGGRVSWESINWQYGHTVWVRIDRKRKRILFGVPINGSTTPNFVFMLDYQWLESAQDIATTEQVTYSSFTGKILSHGRGRRWMPWNIAAASMTYAERDDGTAQPFFGNSGLPSFSVSDPFNRPDENPLAPPWDTILTEVPLQLLGGVVQPQPGGVTANSIGIYIGVAWPPNQSSKATVTAAAIGAGNLQLVVRGTKATASYYTAWVDTTLAGSGIGRPCGVVIGMINAGVQTIFQFLPAGTNLVNNLQVGDTFQLTVTGNLLQFFYNNNLLVQQVDNTLATGSPGLGSFRAVPFAPGILAWDNWIGSAVGTSTGTGKIYQQTLVSQQASDDGVPINSQYNTYFAPSHMDEQLYKLTVDRKLLGGLKWNAKGAGQLSLTVIKDNVVTALRPYTLSISPKGDGERAINMHSERFSVSFGINIVGGWFQMEKFIFKVRRDASIPLRGLNQ